MTGCGQCLSIVSRSDGWALAPFETATILILAALLLSGSERKGKHFVDEAIS
jgi:hypothetical protein